jgi:hypothetical protein
MGNPVTEAEFWSRAKVTPRGCWEWQRGLNRGKERGYGRLKFRGRYMLAHRVAWILQRHPVIGPNERILHACDNPPCINPSHLFAGTQLDNIRDRDAKGRTKKGSDSPHRFAPGVAHRAALAGWETRRARAAR